MIPLSDPKNPLQRVMLCLETKNLVKMNALETVQAEVDALYNFRDHYFENHDIEKASEKNEKLEAKMKDTLSALHKLEDDLENKAQYSMLRGKALNVLPSHSVEAHEALSKAVKLDPHLPEAWVQLGESYWKNKDVDGAKNCFIGALNHSKDKVALRNLSMTLRQVGGDPKVKVQNIEESVEKAKAAVELDIKDGTSWLVLGNAYLSLFFVSNQNMKILKLCMSAYQQAERDVVAKSHPDLHFNRAIAYKYQEEYGEALKGFSRAGALDPNWSEPLVKEKELLNYLAMVHDLVRAKGKLKAKRLSGMVASLKESLLGPYGGGSFTSENGQTVRLNQTTLDQCQLGNNPENVVLGTVVCSLMSDDPVPFTFLIVDKTEKCYCVNVYNMSETYGFKIGDSIAIPEPYLQNVQVKYKHLNVSYKSVRVRTPVELVVNGKKLGLDKQAPAMLSVSSKTD